MLSKKLTLKVEPKEVEERIKALIKVKKEFEERKKEIEQKTNDLESCNLKFNKTRRNC